jgi:pilus assembly protein TadC
MLPHADISTAGVIIAVKTAIAEFESIIETRVTRSFIKSNQAKGNRATSKAQRAKSKAQSAKRARLILLLLALCFLGLFCSPFALRPLLFALALCSLPFALWRRSLRITKR